MYNVFTCMKKDDRTRKLVMTANEKTGEILTCTDEELRKDWKNFWTNGIRYFMPDPKGDRIVHVDVGGELFNDALHDTLIYLGYDLENAA